ncbi:hypothetical protein D3C87_1403560 [compost metagenome]
MTILGWGKTSAWRQEAIAVIRNRLHEDNNNADAYAFLRSQRTADDQHKRIPDLQGRHGALLPGRRCTAAVPGPEPGCLDIARHLPAGRAPALPLPHRSRSPVHDVGQVALRRVPGPAADCRLLPLRTGWLDPHVHGAGG